MNLKLSTAATLTRRVFLGGLLAAWAAATLVLGHLVVTRAPIVHVYPVCLGYNARFPNIEDELDPAFENAYVTGWIARRRLDHSGVYVPLKTLWRRHFDTEIDESEGNKGTWLAAYAVWRNLSPNVRGQVESPGSPCGYLNRFVVKDAKRSWVQTYPWSRIRDPKEIPGFYGVTGVTFEGLKFPEDR
jgi:hypothetical protein